MGLREKLLPGQIDPLRLHAMIATWPTAASASCAGEVTHLMLVDEGSLSKGPTRAVVRYAKLRKLFPGDLDKLTNSRIARLCVLFEDLRIENYRLVSSSSKPRRHARARRTI